MCGLGGFMTADGAAPSRRILDILAGALAHRGPDHTEVMTREGLGFAHTRLSIIDLATGDQPLYGPDGLALIANGEIYNDPELRAGVLAAAPFKTGSDCESILHLYARYGVACADRLRGMYAFALHDPTSETLVLARDPFGIKPLYFAEIAGGLVFASEPQAIIATGLVEAQLTPGAAQEILQLTCTTGGGTAFVGISRVLPGETIVVIRGRVQQRFRRAALPLGPPRNISEREALEALDAVLMDSVSVHRRSDVPYGLFLSSGVDSAAVLSCLARLSGAPVTAFTASFPGTRLADEFPQAHRVAAALGARHINVKIVESDLWTHLPDIAAAVDDPSGDYAIVPTYLLARAAREEVKVVLCGEGGDEIFAGYGRYRRQARPAWLGGRERNPNGPFSALGVLRQDNLDWRRGLIAAQTAAQTPGRTRLQIAQALDCEESLPNCLLNKLDRCLMAHGVEGRTPFLDVEVAQLGFLLPERLKLARGRAKVLLRRWLESRLPEAEPFSKKRGFTVPVGEWILAAGERLGPLVADDPAVSEYCHPARVREIFVSRRGEDQIAAWRLLFFALWHRRHIRGLLPDGDVFECLSSRI